MTEPVATCAHTIPAGPPSLHHFAHGRPARHLYQTGVSTIVPARQRYEFWTSTCLRYIHADPPDEHHRRDYLARVESLATPSGEMHYSASDGFSGVRTVRDARSSPQAELSLLYMLEGQLSCRLDGGDVVTAGPGEFFLYDPGRPQRLAVSRHRMVQVDLDAAQLAAVAGGKAPAPGTLRDALAASGLTRLLQARLGVFPALVAHLSATEQVSLLQATEALALAVIRGAIGADTATDDAQHPCTLEKARHYIGANLDRPDLSPADIAAAVGCSRATLYRVFMRHNMRIASYVRELRLQKMMGLLKNPADLRPIATLAQSCGLYDTPNVSQMFRKRFGASPRDIRAHHAGPQSRR